MRLPITIVIVSVFVCSSTIVSAQERQDTLSASRVTAALNAGLVRRDIQF